MPLAGYVSANAHRRGLTDHPRRVVVLVAGGYGVGLVGTRLLGVAPLVR